MRIALTGAGGLVGRFLLRAFQAEGHQVETLPGWRSDISGAREFADLPATCQSYVRFLEEHAGCRVSAIGVGPDRDATLVLHDLLP